MASDTSSIRTASIHVDAWWNAPLFAYDPAMRQLNFTNAEIDEYRHSMKDWHNFVRRRETEMVFSLIPERRFGRALEIGAGDGGQSVTIAKFCDHLVCTDVDEQSNAWLGQSILERELKNAEYRICDAQDLSDFEAGSFDLVYSSNALEHIPDIDRCLRECKRVLKPDGLMLHAMPTRWWKFFSTLLTCVQFKRPGIHGTAKTHVAEFFEYGRDWWVNTITRNGLEVDDVAGLPFYVGHGNRFIPIIKAGNRMRLPACYLYVVRR